VDELQAARTSLLANRKKIRDELRSTQFEQRFHFSGAYHQLHDQLVQQHHISKWIRNSADDILSVSPQQITCKSANIELNSCLTNINSILHELMAKNENRVEMLSSLLRELEPLIMEYTSALYISIKNGMQYDSENETAFTVNKLDVASGVVMFMKTTIKLCTLLPAHVKLLKSNALHPSFSSTNDWKTEFQSDAISSRKTFARLVYPKLSLHSVMKYFDEIFRDEHVLLSTKFAVISTGIFSLALFSGSAAYFQNYFVMNMLTSFQSVMRLLHFGLMRRRMTDRFLGIFVAYLFGAAILTLVGDSLNGWAVFLTGLPLLAVYLLFKETKKSLSYLLYTIYKEYTVVTIIQQSFGHNPWITGGYVTLNSLIGVVLGVIGGLLIWPSTGKRSLRNMLSDTFLEMMHLYEGLQLIRYEYSNYSTSGLDTKDMEKQVQLAEQEVANRVFVVAPVLLQAAAFEPFDIHPEAPFSSYQKAVDGTEVIARALWKAVYLLSYSHQGLSLEMLLKPLRMVKERMIPTNFCLVSMALKNSIPLPSLRSTSANPQLMQRFWANYLRDVVANPEFEMFSTRSLENSTNMLLQRHIYMEISRGLEMVYRFLDAFLHGEVYYAKFIKHHDEVFNTDQNSKKQN